MSSILHIWFGSCCKWTLPHQRLPASRLVAPRNGSGLHSRYQQAIVSGRVARLGGERVQLYGRDPYEASRIDSFLDASLVFARDAQLYLLVLRDENFLPDIHARAAEAFAIYAAGIEQALQPNGAFLVGDSVTLADICFVAELCLFFNEHLRRGTLQKRGLSPILSDQWPNVFPRASAHFERLAEHSAFAPDVRTRPAEAAASTLDGVSRI